VNFRIRLIYLVCISTILFGCLPKANSTTPFPATATLLIPSTPSLSIAVDLPTTTNTPYINVVSSTLPAIPTLGPNEAFSLLRDFLKNDSFCQLPCWGGITPGKSTVSDAQKQLAILRGISDTTFFGQVENSWVVGTLDIYYPLENTVVHIWPGYVALSGNETVLNIGFGTQSLPRHPKGLVYGDEEYNTLLSAYTLPQMFARYGLPNLIYTQAKIYKTEPTAPGFFNIRLLYLNLGIFISYTMSMEENGNEFQFCPSESLINLELTSSDVGDTYEDFFRQLGNTEWALRESHYQLLEDALGMTNEEFSKAIISSPESCFETPIDIWLEP